MTIKRIIYGAPNYAHLRRKNGYFVDKTEYIAKLERINNPVFLRPRRFGKSFLCSMLHYYYDLNHKDAFEELFGDTWIGKNPTGQQNQYMILKINFAEINPGSTIHEAEANFRSVCNASLQALYRDYVACFKEIPPLDPTGSIVNNLNHLVAYIAALNRPQLFIIIDEYDSFINQLVFRRQDQLFQELVSDMSSLSTFFRVLKSGRESGAIANIYMTGVLPIARDHLISSFNVATTLTFDPIFEAMAGFTQSEVDRLLDEIFEDYKLPNTIRTEINKLIQSRYGGYHFIRPSSLSERARKRDFGR